MKNNIYLQEKGYVTKNHNMKYVLNIVRTNFIMKNLLRIGSMPGKCKCNILHEYYILLMF